ncbi:MAG: DUF6600 domain-containing protein [Ferruginibacter sp.]
MKKIFKYAALLFIISAAVPGCADSNVPTEDDASAPITYQDFYDNLSPYGTWIDYPTYGHVWSPKLDAAFRPYATNGHWAYSNEGWIWASDYDWGWAPFHYGRWLYDDMYGWLWVPGYDWSPAWVTWGSADNFYCWAPLMPGINAAVQYGSWRPHSFYWNICGRDHIYDRNLSAAIQSNSNNAAIINHITVINNFNPTKTHNLYYSKGPQLNEVQKYIAHKIEPVSFKDVDKIELAKHEGNEMKVYRPSIVEPQANTQKPEPGEFRRPAITQVRPIRSEEERPSLPRNEQRNNIEQLPVHRSENVRFGVNRKNK